MKVTKQLTGTEKLYIIKIYQISAASHKYISTNFLAKSLKVKASSVTDMFKRLAAKGIIHYIKYQGCELTKEGICIALILLEQLVLTKQFLTTRLDLNFEDGQDIAEKMIMLDAPILFDRIKRLDNLRTNTIKE